MAVKAVEVNGKKHVEVEALASLLGQAVSVLALKGMTDGYSSEAAEREAIGMAEGYLAVMKVLDLA